MILSVVGAAVLLLALLYYFVPLETFNLLVPKDAGGKIAAKDVAYGEDPRHKVDVYVPTSGEGPWPTVIFIHGGSWSTGNKDPYAFLGQALAAQGFVVMLPNYRLHPQNRYPGFVQDAALVIDWATRHAGEYGGDPKHIYAAGHSAGGYNVAQAVLDKRYLAELGTDASAIRGLILLSAPLDFLPLDPGTARDVFGRETDLPATQPITYVRADAPPTLLLYGTADTTVKPKNSINTAKAMQAVGVNATLKAYAGVSHVGILLAFAKPLHGIAPSLADMVDFIRSH